MRFLEDVSSYRKKENAKIPLYIHKTEVTETTRILKINEIQLQEFFFEELKRIPIIPQLNNSIE